MERYSKIGVLAVVMLSLTAASVEARGFRLPKPSQVGQEVGVNVGSNIIYDAGKAALKKAKDKLRPRNCSGSSGNANSTPQYCQ